MNEVSTNKNMKLSSHFSLGELTKTKHVTPDGTKQDYDELLLEQHGSVCWLHFAVKPEDNRRRIAFLKA